MQRHNIFSQIHKGLRAMLYTTANTLQQTDFTDAANAANTMEQVLDVVNLFDKHAITEDSFVLPAIEKYHKAITAMFEAEHVEDHELSNRLRALITIFDNTAKAEELVVIGSAVRYAFTEFLIFNLKHMAKEEDLLNNLLWLSYTDEQLQGITQQILAHVAPEDMGKYTCWMLIGLNNMEIIEWLKEVRNNAPDFVFNGLFAAAGNELPTERWSQVKEGLVDGLMLA